jgi:NAD(P)-dependent dehydrogenase (short-subunit alcohol dehydrogenase family)
MSTVSLVTGGNRGIGREVCRQPAGQGHEVVLAARSADAALDAALKKSPPPQKPRGPTPEAPWPHGEGCVP